MTKSILFNTKSTQLINILNGTQTMLLTKKLPKDFAGWVYLACGKASPYLNNTSGFNQLFDLPKIYHHPTDLNGKVVARFWYEGENYKFYLEYSDNYQLTYRENKKGELEYSKEIKQELLKKSCFTFEEIFAYGKKRSENRQSISFAIPITKLEVFDNPKELGEFNTYKKKTIYSGMDCPPYVDEVKVALTESPRSWQYVLVKE